MPIVPRSTDVVLCGVIVGCGICASGDVMVVKVLSSELA